MTLNTGDVCMLCDRRIDKDDLSGNTLHVYCGPGIVHGGGRENGAFHLTCLGIDDYPPDSYAGRWREVQIRELAPGEVWMRCWAEGCNWDTRGTASGCERSACWTGARGRQPGCVLYHLDDLVDSDLPPFQAMHKLALDLHIEILAAQRTAR